MKVLITTRKTESNTDVYNSLSVDWYKFLEPQNIEFVAVSDKFSDKYLEEFNGVILSGGGDISSNKLVKNAAAFDLQRENLELNLITKAVELDIPLIGVCRGYQSLVSNLNGIKKVEFIENEFAIKQVYKVFSPDKKNTLTVSCFNKYKFKNIDLVNTWELLAQDKFGFPSAVIHKNKNIAGCIWHPERERNADDFLWNRFLNWMK